MNSLFWRNTLTNLGLGAILDFGLCYLIASVIMPSDQLGWAFGFTAGLWGIQFLLWLKRIGFSIVTYIFWQKRKLRQEFEKSLLQQHFPVYQGWFGSAADYLALVIRDDRSTREQIISAAALLAQTEILKSFAPESSMQMQLAFEAALTDYTLHVSRHGGNLLEQDY